jgi:formylmethanofuran dehydrogenase subunit C
MPFMLRWNAGTTLPVEADCLRPDLLRGRTKLDVASLTLAVGKSNVALGDLFQISGDGADGHLILEGDLSHVRRIGEGMASGQLTIRGDVGGHLGAWMSGGTIEIDGSAGDWAGAEMRGGRLRINGRAGNGLGAAYPGSRLGMRDGVIAAQLGVGNDVGLAMRRGLIVVYGRAGEGLGRGMVAGTIVAFGPAGDYPGAGMKRGTIALFGTSPPALLSTFQPSGRQRPAFLSVYLRWLHQQDLMVPEDAFASVFRRYNGDLVERGQGEILIQEAGSRGC